MNRFEKDLAEIEARVKSVHGDNLVWNVYQTRLMTADWPREDVARVVHEDTVSGLMPRLVWVKGEGQ